MMNIRDHIGEAAPLLDVDDHLARLYTAEIGGIILPGMSCSFEMCDDGHMLVHHLFADAGRVPLLRGMAQQLGANGFHWRGRRGWTRALRMMEA